MPAITLYDNFCHLYDAVIDELNVFDSEGELRCRDQVEERIKVALDLIEELNHNQITNAVKKVKRALPDLFHYLDMAIKVVEECKKLPLTDECLRAYFLAWQWGKGVIKAKKSGRKNMASKQERFYLEFAEGLHQKDSCNYKDEIYSELDKIVQSSAMVECINSIIRPFLNTTKNNIDQDFLNLIMHYHNHRRYIDGKRKDKTPMELLTGKKQTKDWMDILFDFIREKDPEGLLA